MNGLEHDLLTTAVARSKVGRTPACVKTCNSQDTMSATWRKERSTVKMNEITKTAAHRSQSWCWRHIHAGESRMKQHCVFCLVSWCLSWRSVCATALRHELSSFARTLGSWVRISLRVWMFGVCMRLFSVYVVLSLGRGLASLAQGVLQSVNCWHLFEIFGANFL
jgi:hypothetical protein